MLKLAIVVALLLIVWSGNLHRVYASRRTIAAENKRDSGQKSTTHPAELDSGLSATVSES